ncbi:pyrroline-5-carboxylate reductase [Thermoactinomyces sp. CICC 10521]|uniref:pyrroline-5-carboxylate reductase n=1 Tax=Thermoactinomyces sp. CICC 10521 TaxID=2767426 RepID=UPI0018DCC4C0|nr:pyrroline-5-carboxylate reductase [Thermoactinomyces sp. CICC 10521]MBH8608156.1 pyrroline-5-carboxylate reductase [Thermoactinomyces sp. CICC 10521]
MLQERTIGFIGAGSMAEAILAGLLRQKEVSRKQISIINREDQERLKELTERYRLDETKQRIETVAKSDIVILAVKPKDVPEVLQTWGHLFSEDQMLLSVAAGISTSLLEQHVAGKMAVIRVMPNTSCAVGQSATAICPGSHVSPEQLETARLIFRSIGSVIVVDESLMDAVTGLSGSGPAYVYYLAESLEAAGISAGLSPETSRALTVQTLLGASQMLLKTGKAAEELRREVTSPGGTTMAGLEVLDQYQLNEAIKKAVLRAKARSVEMGQQIAITF